MKMKKSLLSVVFLLATSSAMAAMSYSSAEVTSDMSGTVRSTSDSLLALKTGGHDAGWLENGVLKIDFDKAKDKDGVLKDFGMQKNSEYSWVNILKVKNNSENTIDVTIKTENSLPIGVKLFVKLENDEYQEIDSDGAQFNGWDNVWAERALDLKVEVNGEAAHGASMTFTPNLVISAKDASGK